MKREHPLSSTDKAFAAKLAPKCSSPYTVHKLISLVVYEIKSENGGKIQSDAAIQ